MLEEIYNYIQSEELDTSNLTSLFNILKEVKLSQHIPKSVVNNHIVSNGYNIRLFAIDNESKPHEQYDAVIPNTGGMTLRLVAQAGLNWLTTDSGPTVNPDNETLKKLIDILELAEVFSQEEVNGFWALFETPRWPDLTESQVQAALNMPLIEATEGIIQDAESLDTSLTQAEFARQSARTNEINSLKEVLNELKSGIIREVPSMPVGDEWNEL